MDPPRVSRIAAEWLALFAAAAASGDAQRTTRLFLRTGWLRDILVFTWTHRSLCGRDAIFDYLANRLGQAGIADVRLDADHGVRPNYDPKRQIIEAALTFGTPLARGRGLVRLMQDGDGEWRAFTLFLTLDDLKGHEEKGPASGHYADRTKTWNEAHAEERARIEADPHVIIIGAGQSGLNVGARFRQMNIPALLIEKDDVGDVWRNRYPSLTLHTPNTHHAMLYTRFSATAPKFTPRDKVAAMLEQYAYNQDLVIWPRSTVLPTPSYDPHTRRWTVHVLRAGVPHTLHPFHLVLATGTLGAPCVPALPGAAFFRGVALHSSQFRGAAPFKGKHAVVVGACQSAADICQNLARRGAASVTMVQRSRTIVASSEYIGGWLEGLWPLGGDPLVGDFRLAGMPIGALKEVAVRDREDRVKQQKEMLEGLREAGLHVDEGRDGAGAIFEIYERFGGFWIDIGTADLIINRKIAVKHGTEPAHFTADGLGLAFTDGTQLRADLVVFATGYAPVKDGVRAVFGGDVAERVTPVWGVDERGESRRAYTPSGQPGLWWAIGDFMYSRYYSKSLVSIYLLLLLLLHVTRKDGS
ncbi:FAD/NAD(P)-binding domain-containing protein [Gautieria morchelliformis]|nr:FAD/NAD(P)-binding domain-containing protein [Gautieria morchelliformis]